MKPKSGFLTRRILRHALYCKTGRESWKRGTDTAADARAAARQQWSSRRLEGLPGAHKEGPKCWEGKSVCQEMIPTMGCGELERESSSQEVTKTPRGPARWWGARPQSCELQRLAVGLGDGTEEQGDILKMVCLLVMVTVRDIRRGNRRSRRKQPEGSRTSEKQGLL